MPGSWSLSFAAPMFLTPYSLHVFADFLPAFRCEAVPDGLSLLFAALVRPWDAFLRVFIVSFGCAAVGEVEGQVCQVPDADVVYPFEEDLLVEFIKPEDLVNDFLQVILAQAFAGMVFLVSALPIGVLVAVGHDACLLAVVAAAFLAADLRGEAGDIVTRDRVPPAVLRCTLPILLSPRLLFRIPVPVVFKRGAVREFEDHHPGLWNRNPFDTLREDVLVKFRDAEHFGTFLFQDAFADRSA